MLGFILHGQRHDHEFSQGLLTQVLITWTACWCRMMFMIGRKSAAVVSLRDLASVVQVWRMLSRTYKCVASTVQTLIKLSNPLGGGGRNTRNVSSGKLGKSCVITQVRCRSGKGLVRFAEECQSPWERSASLGCWSFTCTVCGEVLRRVVADW